MTFSTVDKWVAKLKSRLQQLKDAAHLGSPATTTTKRNIKNLVYSKKMPDLL